MKNKICIWSCKRGYWLGIFCIITALVATNAYATLLETFDSDGMPFYLEEEAKKNPDRLIEDMKTSLKYGNLDGVGALVEILVDLKHDNPEVRSIYSIYLASKGDTKRANQELKIATLHPKETQYALYAKAMILRLERQYDNAIIACKKAIAMDKSHPYPWNILGRIYCDRQEYKEAMASFKKAIEILPNFLPAYTNLGAVSFITGDYIQSINYFKKAIEMNPGAHASHYGLAMAYEITGNNALAIKEMKKSLELKPDNFPAWQKLAELQLKNGAYKDALKTGKQMEEQGLENAYEILGHASLNLGDIKGSLNYLEKAPAESLVADYLQGFCFMAEQKHQKALGYMERVLVKDKRHFGAFFARATLKFYLGESIAPEKELRNEWGESLGKLLNFTAGSIYAADGNWAGAYHMWQSAENVVSGFSMQGISPDTLTQGLNKRELKYLSLGVLYYFKNLHQHAISEFEKALKINPDSIFANYWKSQVYLKQRNRIKSMEFLENAIEKAPKFFSALYALGELKFLMGEPELASSYYQRALSVKKDAGILIKLGLIFENSGQYKEAAKQYQEVIRLQPDLFIGYNQLAWLYAKRGINLDKAIELAKKADELQPGNSSILDTIGWIYFQQKNYKKALEYVIKAKKIRPNSPTILYHLGAIYHAMGNKKAARQSLERALGISEDFYGANEARELLQR